MQTIYRLLAQITYLRKQLILKRARELQKTDFTPDNAVPDEVACVYAVTTLLYNIGLVPRIEVGTYTFGQQLLRRQIKGWFPTPSPTAGDIAIAMTGTGNGKMRGHCWIVGEDGWYSNNSYTGLWERNYTKETAEQRYEKEGGMKIFYFTYLSVI